MNRSENVDIFWHFSCILTVWYFATSCTFLFIMRSRLLGFGPGGYPSHAYFSPLPKNKYIVKPHLTLIRFRAWGVPISRNPLLMTKKNASSSFGPLRCNAQPSAQSAGPRADLEPWLRDLGCCRVYPSRYRYPSMRVALQSWTRRRL